MRRAFTLLELLIVLTVIAALLAVILPGLADARKQAKATVCSGGNMRSIMQGTLVFATDHRDRLLGWYTWTTPGLAPHQRDFNSGEYGPVWGELSQLVSWACAPEHGTLFPYLGGEPGHRDSRVAGVYRCPSVPLGSEPGARDGSNGRYDYSPLGGLGGASLTMLPQDNTLYLRTPWISAEWVARVSPIPLWFEEDYTSLNHLPSMAASLAGTDRLGRYHFGRSHAAGMDGSVHRLGAAFSRAFASQLVLKGHGPVGRTVGVQVGVDPWDRWDMWGKQLNLE